MKRQRGRGRKPGGGGNYHHNNNQGGHHHPNRQLETNGPEIKFRGTASHIHERYLALARDAQSSGDRVLSEAYLQYADHYFRLVRSMQPATPVQQPQQNLNDGEFEGDEEVAAEGDGSEESEVRAEGEDQASGDFQGERQQYREGGGERGDGGQRRGRNRRRFRPDGDRDGGYEARDGERSEGGEPREDRERRQPRERAEGEPREPRRERQPREDRESASREGFSDGPKPAFLRSGGGSSE
ncbi:MAG: DUF4167 domain-containing protein [Hyphomonadaceae bacterium]|nr:DUF4167 domain-containing protein [Hyphomonadaceae bacterium]